MSVVLASVVTGEKKWPGVCIGQGLLHRSVLESAAVVSFCRLRTSQEGVTKTANSATACVRGAWTRKERKTQLNRRGGVGSASSVSPRLHHENIRPSGRLLGGSCMQEGRKEGDIHV